MTESSPAAPDTVRDVAEDGPVGYFYVMAQIDLALRPRFDAICSGQELTLTQYTALSLLERRPGLTSSELARRSFVRPQSMASTMAPLLERGLVRREVDAEHRRRMLLHLTEQGSEVLRLLAPELYAVESLMVAGLSVEARAALLASLRHARDGARAGLDVN